ncbi:gliding motility-associated ABC transporter substrate-binding protein GldG [Bacteroidota bacterium]
MVIPDSRKLTDILIFLIGLMIIVNINLLIRNSTFRVDLTEEKRYTISKPTIQLLEDLNDVVYFEVYLEGDFPSGFKRLQRTVRETLEEFRVYAGDYIQYQFINPSTIGQQGKQQLIQRLGNLGIQPTNLYATEHGERTEKLIFPGAAVAFGDREIGAMLLKGNKSADPQERLNQSVEGVEYELASAIRKLVEIDRKRIAVITGHGELEGQDIVSASNILLESYDVFHVDLERKEDLSGYDVMIISKPETLFSESDKYKIDQFIMHGGKSIILIDQLKVEMDSIGNEGTIGYPYDLNLSDMLFRYGIRMNNSFIADLNSGAYPVVVGNMGDQPQISLLPWPYFPLINQFSDHPIVKSLDAVYLRFANAIDTVKAQGIRKTPLMFSSVYSKNVAAPVHISLNDLKEKLKPEYFSQGPYPVAYLLEGNFTSLYKNRLLPEGSDPQSFLEDGVATKIIICADGDLFRNEINRRNGQPFDLGYDPFVQNTFANADFMENALSYLLDENGLILSRTKEIKIRPLDQVKIEDGKVFWQSLNIVLPLTILFLFGFLKLYLRKRKYTRY